MLAKLPIEYKVDAHTALQEKYLAKSERDNGRNTDVSFHLICDGVPVKRSAGPTASMPSNG